MSTPRKATRRQLEAALDTLAIVSETEDLQGFERDFIGAIRGLLWDVLEKRAAKRKAGS